MKKSESSLSIKLKAILYVKPEDLNLNFIFNHVKNYAVAASVAYAGIALVQTSILYSLFLGVFLLFISIILVSLNLFQIIYGLSQSKLNTTLYFIISLTLSLAGMNFFSFLVLK